MWQRWIPVNMSIKENSLLSLLSITRLLNGNTTIIGIIAIDGQTEHSLNLQITIRCLDWKSAILNHCNNHLAQTHYNGLLCQWLLFHFTKRDPAGQDGLANINYIYAQRKRYLKQWIKIVEKITSSRELHVFS